MDNQSSAVKAVKAQLALYPNSLFSFERNTKVPNSDLKTNVVATMIDGNAKLLDLGKLVYSDENAIDQLITDHNTAAYERSLQTGNRIDEVLTSPATLVAVLPAGEDAVTDAEIEDDELEDDEDDEFLGFREDLQRDVPEYMIRLATETQRISDDTILQKLGEYTHFAAQVDLCDAMINLAIEATIVDRNANPAGIVSQDGSAFFGFRGPTAAYITGQHGPIPITYADHRLQGATAQLLDGPYNDVLAQVSKLMVNNVKRQVLEIADAVDWVRVERKSFLNSLADIVFKNKTRDENETGRDTMANGKAVHTKVVAHSFGSGLSAGALYLSINGTVNDVEFTANVTMHPTSFDVEIFGIYGDERDTASQAIRDSEAYYRELEKHFTTQRHEDLIEKAAEHLPAAKQLARSLADEIEATERGLLPA